MQHSKLSSDIIGAFYQVFNTLGYGFLEKVYENALYLELRSRGYYVVQQESINVTYLDSKVGLYYADLFVDGKIIVEIKAAESLCEEHECQLLNYLKATEMEVGLLLNFGKTAEVRRKMFSNELKRSRKSA